MAWWCVQDVGVGVKNSTASGGTSLVLERTRPGWEEVGASTRMRHDSAHHSYAAGYVLAPGASEEHQDLLMVVHFIYVKGSDHLYNQHR